jgi:hypothetical protein
MKPIHPFAAMREKMKKSGFATLTNMEKWEWHADAYAVRRVCLSVPLEVRVSPPDPDGQWFREDLVERVVCYYREFYRAKFDTPERTKRKARRDTLQREGRDIVTKWVQSQGFVSVDDYCERHGSDVLTAHRDYLKSPEFQAVAKARDGGACG